MTQTSKSTAKDKQAEFYACKVIERKALNKTKEQLIISEI